MESLRILWLNWRDITNPSAGGSELYTHEIAGRLARAGHEVTLLCSRYTGGKEEQNMGRFRIVRIGNRATVYVEAARFYRSQCGRGETYDIVIDAINTVPFVSTLYVHGTPVIALVYQLTGEIFLKEFPPFVGRLLSNVERLSLAKFYGGRVSHLITLSGSAKTELTRVCHSLNPDSITVVPPGVDHSAFAPGPRSSTPLVLFLNRLVKYKQPDHVIRTMKEVSSCIGNARLLVVGTLADARRAARLEQLVRSLGLEKNVTIVVTPPFRSARAGLLQQAWVHVLPSVKEGFGISCLEAAACGTPTVGYDVPGVKDAVRHGETGVLVEPGDILSLSRAIVGLLSERQRIEALGKNAVEWARAFTWDRAAARFEEAISHC